MCSWSQQDLITARIMVKRVVTTCLTVSWWLRGQGTSNHTFSFQIVTRRQLCKEPWGIGCVPASGRITPWKNSSQSRRAWQPMLGGLPVTGQPQVPALYSLQAPSWEWPGNLMLFSRLNWQGSRAGHSNTFALASCMFVLGSKSDLTYQIHSIRAVGSQCLTVYWHLTWQIDTSRPSGKRSQEEPPWGVISYSKWLSPMQKALRILFITQCPPPTSLLFLTLSISLQLSTLHLLTPIALIKRVHLITLNTFCLGSYCLPSSLISSMAYSSLFSITVINTMIQSNWAWTGSISPYSLYHWGEVMA